MKTLIVYYSKTGNTKAVAKELAQNLNADLEELTEIQSKAGIVGMLIAGKDAMFEKSTAINDLKLKLSDYDLVIIGTPIWMWTMSNPIRGFIEKYKTDLKKVAFFATMGSSGDKRTFSQMEKLSGLTPVATVAVTEGKVKKGEFKGDLATFIETVKK